MVRRLLLAFLLAIFATCAAAQSSSSLPSFDAVTVKPFMGTVTHGSAPQPDPGRLTIEHSTPEQMIAYAFGINLNQIAGLPDWARHDRFQVTGVTHAAATPDQLKLMLRRVLAERFQLAYTDSDAVQPVEALEVAPGGSNLKPWHAPTACGQGMTADEKDKISQLPRPILAVHTPCTMAELVSILNGRPAPALPVVDKTGLTGQYAILVSQSMQPSPAGGRRPQSLPDAIREELGLVLVKTTAPWPMLHITRIAHPAPDK